jgi:N-hydroxyarylamine O-acetyltransferase
VNAIAPSAPLSSEQVEAYLARISHPTVRAADRETLAGLQDAHVRSVPFENLDIHLGVPLSLETEALFDKVVTRQRGGFCFELNGLFHRLLISLGFDAWLVEARELRDDGELGPRFDHARILVALDGETLLVDVGTGASPRGPIRLSEEPQQVGHVRSRVRTVDGRYVSDRLEGGAWAPGWTFDAEPRELADFAERCHYHQHSPESHFTQKPLCTLVTRDGHVTLSDRTLIETRGEDRRERVVDDPLAVLESRFGVTLPRWPGT